MNNLIEAWSESLMSKNTFVAFAFVLVTLAPSLAAAKVNVTRKTIYYDARGTTGAAIYKSMEATKRRMRLPGVGALQPKLTIDASGDDLRETDRGCALGDLDLNLELIFYYPKWVLRKSASRDVQRAWDNWYSAVVVHEEKHASQTQAAVRRLDARFKKVARNSRVGCLELLKLLLKESEAAGKAFGQQVQDFEKREFLSNSKNVLLTKKLIEAK